MCPGDIPSGYWSEPLDPDADAIEGLVCGLPDDVRERHPLVMLRAFLDDSGNDGRSPLCILAGFITTLEHWRDFTKEWRAELGSDLPYFRMAEAESKKEHGWAAMTPAERDARVERFAAIPGRHKVVGLCNIVPNDSVRRHITKRARVASEDPMYICLMRTLDGIGKLYESSGYRGGLSVFFDMPPRKAETRYSRLIAKVLKMRGQPGFRHVHHLDVNHVGWVDDKLVLPAQAADLLSWHMNRSFCFPNEPRRKAMQILGQNRIIGTATFDKELRDAGPESPMYKPKR